MTIAYLNGDYMPLEEARISPMDRGFLFGDAVYEVVPVHSGRPILLESHIQAFFITVPIRPSVAARRLCFDQTRRAL